MKTTIDFLNDLKAKYSLKSNYAVAKFLQQTEPTVGRWAKGAGSFSDETAMHIADLLDIDPAFVVACIHAERAKNQPEKKLWERFAKLAGGVTALVFAVIMSASVLLDSSTKTAPSGAEKVVVNIHYAFPEWLNWAVVCLLIIALIFAFPRSNPHQKGQL